MNLLGDGIANESVQQTKQVVKLTVDGETSNYPVYRVRLNNLFFNDQNDRIATWISQYKAENGEDSLSREDLEHYNDVIQSFIEKSNPEKIKQTQENIKLVNQQKYGVVLNDGRIIDGNRRFTCLRNLSKDSDNFSYFETVILEKDYEHSAKQIKMLELQIQIGSEERVDYDPIDRLVGIYRDIVDSKLLTIKEYARSTNQKEKDVKKDLEIAKLMVEYLEAIKAPKQYYLARELQLDGPIRELYSALKNIDDEDKKQELKYIAFANLLIKPNEDMTRFVRKLKDISKSTYLDEFIEKEEDIAETTLDDLPEDRKVNSEVIAKVRADVETKDKLQSTMDIVSNKVKAKETRDKPNKLLKQAINSLSSIDAQIIKRLNDEQIEDIKVDIERLEEVLRGVKDAVQNV
ncbi:hypothetical protein [Sharpea azabuensis]|uniref:hypothetical protein n=1 Tax=Sharpea azabuensis TaxID=322505 RepID=UPI0015696E16|nr:hypothetical protein [Sharpea azabuensis]